MSEKTTPKRVTRREFLRGAALAGAGLALASCAPQVIKETVVVEQTVEVEKQVEVTKEVEKEVVVEKTVEVMSEEQILRIWTTQFFNPDITLHLIRSGQEGAAAIGFEAVVEPIVGSFQEYAGKLTAAYEAGTLADIFAPQILTQAWMTQGIMMPIPDVYDKVGADGGGWHPIADRNFSMGGVGYMLNIGYAPGFMHIREDLVNDAGFSLPFADLAELRECAIAINDPDHNVYGTAFTYSEQDDLMHLQPLMWAMGGAAFDEEGNPTMERQENIDALTWFTDLYLVDKVSPEAAVSWTGGGNNQAYLTGQGAMCMNPGSVLAAVRRGDTPIEGLLEKTYCAPWPQWSDEYGPQAQTEAGQGFGIQSETKFPDAAKEVLSYMFSLEQYTELQKMGQSYLFPALMGVYEDPYFADDRWNVQIVENVVSIMKDESWPAAPKAWTNLWSTWAGPACVDVCVNGMTPAEAMAKAQKTMEDIIAEYEAG